MPRFYFTIHTDGGSDWESINPAMSLLIDFENEAAARSWADRLYDKLNSRGYSSTVYFELHTTAKVLSAEQASKHIVEYIESRWGDGEEDEE